MHTREGSVILCASFKVFRRRWSWVLRLTAGIHFGIVGIVLCANAGVPFIRSSLAMSITMLTFTVFTACRFA